RHGRLDLATLLWRQATVMEGYGEIGVVLAPERLEDQLRLRPGIDENKRRLGLLDAGIDFADGVQSHMTRPGQILFCHQNLDDRLGPGPAVHQRRVARGAYEPRGQRRLVGDGGREADETAVRRQLAEAREPEREQIAALVARQRMQLV